MESAGFGRRGNWAFLAGNDEETQYVVCYNDFQTQYIGLSMM